MAAAAGPLYRLADYLDQHGRAHRASQIPPAEFWSAAAAHAAPGDQAALGDAADARGLYRDAAQLHKNAAASGNPGAVFYLSHPPACLRADPRPAHWAAAHVALDDPDGVAVLLDSLRKAGADEQAAALLARDPAAHVPLDDPDGVASLLDRLREAGADEQAAALAARSAAHAALDDPDAWPACWTACGRRARTSRPPRWPARAAAHALLDDPDARGQPAGQPAGGGRGRAGRRAGRPTAGGRHVRALPRAERPCGSVPFRTGGRRHPGAAMGLGRPRLMACSSAAGDRWSGATLSRVPTWGPARQTTLSLGSHDRARVHSGRYVHRRRNRKDDLNNRCSNRSGHLFEAQLAGRLIAEINFFF